MNDILKNPAPLFQELEYRIRNFKKDTYEDIFIEYMEQNHVFFEELNLRLSEDGCDLFIAEFTKNVIACAGKLIENAGNKVKREGMQLNLNMFMAVYFLPAVLEGGQRQAKELADAICTAWGAAFKGNNIKGAGFKEIQEGFRSKLCYVTTAVCRSLNKPEDCYELNLLKNYRDQYLANTEGGEELVAKYYDIAPTIVKRINRSGSAGKIYKDIWNQYLKPCIAMIENGENEECGRTYIRMVEELRQRYLVTSDRERHGY